MGFEKMKKIIIILGTILLGVYVVGTFIMGEDTGLKGNADSITEKSNNLINEQLLKINTNGGE